MKKLYPALLMLAVSITVMVSCKKSQDAIKNNHVTVNGYESHKLFQAECQPFQWLQKNDGYANLTHDDIGNIYGTEGNYILKTDGSSGKLIWKWLQPAYFPIGYKKVLADKQGNVYSLSNYYDTGKGNQDFWR